jgi:neutral ceramidase
MPLLSYGSALPLDFWDILSNGYDSMARLVTYLTAITAVASPAVQGVAGQYLLGLGEFKSFVYHASCCQYLSCSGIGDITGYALFAIFQPGVSVIDFLC